jgi:hypothetical protein
LISGTCAALAGVCAKFTFNFSSDEPFAKYSGWARILLHLGFFLAFILANAVML